MIKKNICYECDSEHDELYNFQYDDHGKIRQVCKDCYIFLMCVETCGNGVIVDDGETIICLLQPTGNKILNEDWEMVETYWCIDPEKCPKKRLNSLIPESDIISQEGDA